METPFYLWTIVEALEWLVNVPVLGFAALLLLAVVLLQLAIISALFWFWLTE